MADEEMKKEIVVPVVDHVMKRVEELSGERVDEKILHYSLCLVGICQTFCLFFFYFSFFSFLYFSLLVILIANCRILYSDLLMTKVRELEGRIEGLMKVEDPSLNELKYVLGCLLIFHFNISEPSRHPVAESESVRMLNYLKRWVGVCFGGAWKKEYDGDVMLLLTLYYSAFCPSFCEVMYTPENRHFYGKILDLAEHGKNVLVGSSVVASLRTNFDCNETKIVKWILNEGAFRCCVKALGCKRAREDELLLDLYYTLKFFFCGLDGTSRREMEGWKKSEEYRREMWMAEEEGFVCRVVAGRYEDAISHWLKEISSIIGVCEAG
jgi:hypothetical protein